MSFAENTEAMAASLDTTEEFTAEFSTPETFTASFAELGSDFASELGSDEQMAAEFGEMTEELLGSSGGSGGSGGTSDHSQLTGRSLPNQHPMSAINGLEDALANKLAADELQGAVNLALEQAKESGEFDGADGKDGKDGYTPVKGKDYFDGQDGLNGRDGVDGYTPQKGIDYFDGVDGKNGTDGRDGVDGYTPQKGIDYFDGVDGQNGVDGYTPIKGVDYFDGVDGVDGQDGLNGKSGVVISDTEPEPYEDGTRPVWINPNGDETDVLITPADYIIEQGTTNGWNWEKWNSGKYVCYGIFTDTCTHYTVVTPFYGYYSTNFAYPITFPSPPIVLFNCKIGNGFGMPAGDVMRSSSACRCYALSTAKDTVTCVWEICVIGKWE